MFQKLLNSHFNLEDLHLNDSFIQETVNPTNDYSIFSISNLNYLNQPEYEKEVVPLINESKSLLFNPKNNLIESFEKEKDFNNKILNKEFLFENKNKDYPTQSTDFLDSEKSKYNLIEKYQLLQKRKKAKANTIGKHTKYAEDNLRRKIKYLVLKYALEFLNEKIRDLYKGNIGSGISKKELVPLNRIYKVDTSIEKYKKFVYKTLGEIFSGNISTRFKINLPEYNKILIKRLLNDKDENKRLYFQRLFNIKFLKCIETFSGSDSCKELKGFKTFNDIKNSLDYEYEPEYINRLEYYLKNFGEILINKNRKKVRPEKEQKGKEEVCKDKK